METNMEQRQVEPIIQLTDVRKIYKMGTQVVKALDGATITIYPNEYVAINGPVWFRKVYHDEYHRRH